MAIPKMKAAGGFAAIEYVLKKGREVGYRQLWSRLRSKKASKTCALGMGGQRGGIVNEAGQFNIVVYEEEDLYRGIPRRDALLVAEDVAANYPEANTLVTPRLAPPQPDTRLQGRGGAGGEMDGVRQKKRFPAHPDQA